MKKIAILTLNGYINYGNRLQNYALQETMKGMGYDVNTIRIQLTSNKELVKSFLRETRNFLVNPSIYKMKKERENIFITFSKEYISESENIFFLNDDLSCLNSKFDYFVAGSDQIWNPNMNKMSSFYFLNFGDENKRIAYAPSFGISELSKDIEVPYKKWISEIPYLSIREKEGASIIKSLTGRDSEVLIDPTMLLTKDKWLSISKCATNKPPKKYLLTYFLGGIPKEYEEQLNDLANKYSLEIVNLSDINEPETYCTGPSEFIDYIENCSIFCTDSFHGVVFSILLKKPFIVYERETINGTMYSRIETLLDKFNFRNREAKNFKFQNNVFEIDFSGVPVILDQERQKSFNFLAKALNPEFENVKLNES